MNNSTAFEKIYADLRAGYSFGRDVTWNYYDNEPLRYPFFDAAISYDPIKKLFRWSHFGRSANKATKKDLAWLLSDIFECSAADFLKKYIRSDESKVA